MKSYIEKLQTRGRMQFSSILVSTPSTAACDHFSGEGSSFHPLSYWPIKYSLPLLYGSLHPRLKFSQRCLAKLQHFLNSKDANSNTFCLNVFVSLHSNPCYQRTLSIDPIYMYAYVCIHVFSYVRSSWAWGLGTSHIMSSWQQAAQVGGGVQGVQGGADMICSLQRPLL